MEQNQSYGKRMWGIWSPLLIKYGIACVVSMLGMFIFTGVYIMEQGQTGDVMNLMEQTNDMAKLMMEAAERLLDHAVPLEGFTAAVTIPVLLFLIHRDRKKEEGHTGMTSIKKAPLWKYPSVMVMSAALCLVLNNFIMLSDISSYSEGYEETMEILYEPSFGMQLVCLGILMPVCEELTYRGLMYRRMRRQVRFIHAAVYSSLIFAITHGNLVQALYGFVMGMMLAYIYEKFGSAAAPVLGHITANCISVAGTQFRWFDWIFEDIMHVGGVTVICSAAAATVYVLLQRMEPAFPEAGKVL